MIIIKEFFPISGILKEPLLILEWLIFFITLELSIFLAIRLRRNKRELGNYGETSYIYLSFGYSFMWMFLIIADFYITSTNLRNQISNVGFLIIINAVIIFIFLTEKKHFIYKRYFFTAIYCLLMISYIIVWFVNIDITIIISISFWIIFVLYFILYYRDLFKNYHVRNEIGKTRKQIINFIVGFSFINVGYQIAIRLSFIQLYLYYRFVGDIFQVIGAYFLFLFFSNVPSLSELHWKKKIETLYIIHKSGLLIYDKHFVNKTDYIESSLKSGGIVSVEMILEHITNSIGISLIERKDKKIIIYSGKYLYGVIISEEVLKTHQYILNKIISSVEAIYSHILIDWQGDLRVFSPVNDIVNDILKLRLS